MTQSVIFCAYTKDAANSTDSYTEGSILPKMLDQETSISILVNVLELC